MVALHYFLALRYFPTTNSKNNEILEHEDGNCVTFVIQDNVGGLQVRKNNKWIPITPNEGTIMLVVAQTFSLIYMVTQSNIQVKIHNKERPNKGWD